jgi:hypothetical protein
MQAQAVLHANDGSTKLHESKYVETFRYADSTGAITKLLSVVVAPQRHAYARA